MKLPSAKPSQVAKNELLRLMAEGVPLKRIAHVTRVDRSSLHKWLNGTAPRGISADSLDKIFLALNMVIVQRGSKKAAASRLNALAKALRKEEDANAFVPPQGISPIFTEDEIDEEETGCSTAP